MANKFRINEKIWIKSNYSNQLEIKYTKNSLYSIEYKSFFGWKTLREKTTNTCKALTFKTYDEAEDFLFSKENKNYAKVIRKNNEYEFIPISFGY